MVSSAKAPIGNCTEAYVGKTKQSLKVRFSQHRRPSSSEYQANSAIYEHSKSTGHKINTEDVVILDREERWFERGVKEAIYERVEKPSLNKRGGLRFQLSHAWNQSLINIPCQLTVDQSSPINPTGNTDSDTNSSLHLPDEAQ